MNKVIHHLHRAIECNPEFSDAHVILAQEYKKKDDFLHYVDYLNKAINIDEENVLYWKRYAKINSRLNFPEEAEQGYKKSLELGNYELETWIRRCDILIGLGEYETAISSMMQALEFYPGTAEVEYRLAGLYFNTNNGDKGYFHLNNALKTDSEYYIIIEELFPNIFERKSIKQIINSFVKLS